MAQPPCTCGEQPNPDYAGPWNDPACPRHACGVCRVIHVTPTEVEVAINSECIVHMPRSAFTLDDDEMRGADEWPTE